MVWTCEKGRGGVLCEVGEVKAGEEQLMRTPRKKWSDFVMEDNNLLGAEENVA